MIGTQECVNNCSINEREKGICKINYISQDENNKESEEKAVENIKEQLTKDFNTSDVDYGKDIVIKQQYSTITITTTENQKKEKSSNSTTIDLGECENIIKDEYNISKNKSLYILKIDVKQKGLKIPKIVYEVYYPLFGDNLIKLNLTVCKNSKIVISIPVALTEDIDIINPKSDFYNDICYTYTSEDGTDISLLDRKKNFVDNNLTICEEDCDFNEYNYTTGKVTCSCDANINPTTKIGDISFDKNKLFNSFINFKNIMNIDVLKCYKLIFKLDSFMHNYANLTMLIILVLFVITLFIFYFRDCYNLEKILTLIVYFKINLNLAKKFLKKKKDKKKIKLNNLNNLIVIKKQKKKNKICNKAEIIDDLNSQSPFQIQSKKSIKKNELNEGIKKNFDIFDEHDNAISNPNKKKKKNQKIKDNILSQKNEENYSINKKDYPYNMSKKILYKMFVIINNESDSELNDLDYKDAIRIDKRNYLQYYLSLIRTKHLLFFSFWPSFDYNSQIIKIFLFSFDFILSFLINALFFNDETMHKIYEEKGSFNFIYNIPQILYSSLITGFIDGLIQELALTDSNLINLKQEKDNNNIEIKKQKALKIIKIKLFLFFVLTLLLLVSFWFYLACFCAVYKNTQIHLIKDTVISFVTSMITPFGIYILPGIFRIGALNAKNKDKEYMFKFSKALQML